MIVILGPSRDSDLHNDDKRIRLEPIRRLPEENDHEWQ